MHGSSGVPIACHRMMPVPCETKSRVVRLVHGVEFTDDAVVSGRASYPVDSAYAAPL